MKETYDNHHEFNDWVYDTWGMCQYNLHEEQAYANIYKRHCQLVNIYIKGILLPKQKAKTTWLDWRSK